MIAKTNLLKGRKKTSHAFAYIKDNDGIDTEASYPYEASDEKCRYTNRTRGANEIGKIDLREGDEKQLQIAVARIGPVSVGIDASSNLTGYSKGIYSSNFCSQTKLDHGVLVVGYGTEMMRSINGTKKQIDYWIVKNRY
ncbi:unnamed protein product [Gongylonema pulchrum]|uniref:Pept_C1 domain-containing protein n=1 Tax=Gongylonema pulchrum TaxID=637853 RepID=A0A183DKY9_9BILA|nr:unnamed protein product [Gongylonema pulchrum]